MLPLSHIPDALSLANTLSTDLYRLIFLGDGFYNASEMPHSGCTPEIHIREPKVVAGSSSHVRFSAKISDPMDLSTLPPDTPALQPPTGQTSNFDHVVSMRPEIYATIITCLSVSTVFVWIRLYTRISIIRSHGWEDCGFERIPESNSYCTQPN